ncbi:non-canonical purine NTP pyrophosphatase [Synoicihabitans lomoniglobus]|uniref:dITP/XTP pyrophosphatase n=1 Tax=Synoicihabitans lomoniglobus TaxID=2909285 RepID=A0AAF0CS83_9BACT|nr:non-canonical purine NTP pyrophosphatase [Opitutaceae bacterium LMO-M01]WED67072.1 non-canonical purine NTP pyrophosphatase [Opitutaceae bacterium LMO-M01]
MNRQPIYLASGNTHKVSELQRLADADDLPVDIHSAREVGGMPEVVEDTGTFVGNATKKAVALLAQLPAGAWALADDSGICVDALGGAPGVESAYFAGPVGDDDANLQKLVTDMRHVSSAERGAHYVCVLQLAGPDGLTATFEGRCHGTLAIEPDGSGGFGYDPLFIPAGYSDTFGVLPAETKQALSHRARAWQELAAWMRRQPRG